MKLKKCFLLTLCATGVFAIGGCAQLPKGQSSDHYISAGNAPSDDDPMMGGNVLPPQYLHVPKFSTCLDAKKVSSFQIWCMPSTQPPHCPNSSWRKLKSLQGVPDCDNKSPT